MPLFLSLFFQELDLERWQRDLTHEAEDDIYIVGSKGEAVVVNSGRVKSYSAAKSVTILRSGSRGENIWLDVLEVSNINAPAVECISSGACCSGKHHARRLYESGDFKGYWFLSPSEFAKPILLLSPDVNPADIKPWVDPYLGRGILYGCYFYFFL